MPDSTLDIVITATDRASGELVQIDRKLDSMDQSAKKASRGGGIIQTALGVAGGMFAFSAITSGLSSIGKQFSDSIELAKIQMNAEKQLNAVLESTGHAAGLSANELKTMASELQNVTNFGDEAIIGGQNLLLTFTGIGKDVFPAATETMLDMSQALGQDMKSSAIQLGKALNDPVAGVTALSRVGVSFTEEQKEMIKTMVEAGDVAGAQGLILAELGKEFGGSARALADPAIQLSNAWGDFKEVIGAAIIPILNNLAKQVMPIVLNAIEYVSDVIHIMTGEGYDLEEMVGALTVKFKLTDEQADRLWNTVSLVVDIFKNFIWWLKQGNPILTSLANAIYDVTGVNLTWLETIQEGIPILTAIFDLIKSISRLGFQAMAWMLNNVTLPALRAVWSFIDGFVIRTFGSWAGAIDAVVQKIQGLINWVGGVSSALSNLRLPSWLGGGGNVNVNSAPANISGRSVNNYNVTVNATNTDPSTIQRSTLFGVQDALLATGR